MLALEEAGGYRRAPRPPACRRTAEKQKALEQQLAEMEALKGQVGRGAPGPGGGRASPTSQYHPCQAPPSPLGQPCTHLLSPFQFPRKPLHPPPRSATRRRWRGLTTRSSGSATTCAAARTACRGAWRWSARCGRAAGGGERQGAWRLGPGGCHTPSPRRPAPIRPNPLPWPNPKPHPTWTPPSHPPGPARGAGRPWPACVQRHRRQDQGHAGVGVDDAPRGGGPGEVPPRAGARAASVPHGEDGGHQQGGGAWGVWGHFGRGTVRVDGR
jgi:hypothetical protein